MTVNHLYPTTRPTLDLNFARQKRLDPRVTFTRGSTATYVGSDGLIKTAAANEARFDHDPATGESLGLLVEESRTNLLPYSNTFDYTDPSNSNNSYVFRTGGNGTTPVLTANYTTAPDGTNTGWRLQCEVTSGTTSGDYSRLRGPFISSATHVFGSIYVKSNTGANQTFAFSINGGSNGLAYTATPEWTRIDQMWVVNPVIYIGLAGNVTGPGTLDISIWGAQLEHSSQFPTSYIPTSGSTVTRSADVASMAGTNFSSWYNQSEGTFFSKYLTRGASQYFRIWKTNNNVIQIINPYGGDGAIQAFIQYNGQQVNSSMTFANGANVYDKSVFALKENDFAWTVNGNTVGTDSVGLMPPSQTYLNITSASGSNPVERGCAAIARLTYYPTRLTNSQLQELTR